MEAILAGKPFDDEEAPEDTDDEEEGTEDNSFLI